MDISSFIESLKVPPDADTSLNNNNANNNNIVQQQPSTSSIDMQDYDDESIEEVNVFILQFKSNVER